MGDNRDRKGRKKSNFAFNQPQIAPGLPKLPKNGSQWVTLCHDGHDERSIYEMCLALGRVYDLEAFKRVVLENGIVRRMPDVAGDIRDSAFSVAPFGANQRTSLRQ